MFRAFFLVFLMMTTVMYGQIIKANYRVSYGVLGEVGIAKAVIYVILLRLSLSFNITPGNLGIQEILLGLLTRLTNFGTGIGITISIIIRIVTYLVLGISSISFGLKSINKKEI